MNPDRVTRILSLRALAVLLVVPIAALAFSGTAHAQDGTLTAFCEEYPDDPACEKPEEEEKDPPDRNQAPTGGADDGELPFTGYPLTPLVLLILALLAAGLALRSAIVVRERISRE